MSGEWRFAATASFTPAIVPGPFPGPPAAARAMAASLGCPDLCLIRASTGPETDRFTAAMAATAARLGQRTLVVATCINNANTILAFLDAERDPAAVRILEPNEDPTALPAHCQSRSTLAYQQLWDAEHETITTKAQAILRDTETEHRLALADLDRYRTEFEQISVDLEAAIERETRKLAKAQDELTGLQPLREAKEQKRIWSGLFWKAMLNTDVTTRVTELEREANAASAAIQSAKEHIEKRNELSGKLDQLKRDIVEFTTRETAAREGLHQATQLPQPTYERFPIAVAPMAALGVDPCCREGLFETVIVPGAERYSILQFQQFASRGKRTILLGDRFRSTGPDTFAKLLTEHDTAAWAMEGPRLVCRLQRVPLDQRLKLKAEPVADHPDIELRFLQKPSMDTTLAEVVFPPAISAAEAREWIATEWGEVYLTPCGPHHWHGLPNELRACWHLADTVPEAHRVWAELGEGIRELVAGTGVDAVTAAVEFDCKAGWELTTAEAWLTDRLIAQTTRVYHLPKIGTTLPASALSDSTTTAVRA